MGMPTIGSMNSKVFLLAQAGRQISQFADDARVAQIRVKVFDEEQMLGRIRLDLIEKLQRVAA